MTNSGKLLIITAPSGAGKTTIVRHLLETIPELSFSVSATNRPRRPMEINGRDYYFLTTERFREMVEQGAFLEWEEVYTDQYYGTLRSEVSRIRSEGKVVIFDIDVQGALNLKKEYGDQALSIFIQPPSLEALIERLKNRKTEDAKSLQKRIDRATQELTFKDAFDQTIMNDDLNQALSSARKIVREFIGPSDLH
ncbi:MAG: guanylate kinase [Saprospiraceae bacterium]|nr:guanylate kinase [Saprospiraceae bacterium]